MGAHAICDETKCKIPVYSKEEVDNLLNNISGQINELRQRDDALSAGVDDNFAQITSLKSWLGELTARLTALEEKVGG